MCEEPWTQVSRFTGRKRGAVPRGAGGAPPAPPAAGGEACFWRDAPAFQGAVAAHLQALAANAGLVAALWRHLLGWRRASARAAAPAALLPAQLQCVGLGSVSAQGPSGSSIVQLALLLLLARLLQRSGAGSAAEAPPPSAEELGAELDGCGEQGDGGGVEAVDPCFSPQDALLLASVGVAARSAPWQGPPRGGAAPALLFMPHCPGALYTAALAGFAWRGAEAAGDAGDAPPPPPPLPLPCLCLVGNGFREYVERRRRSEGGEGAAAAGEPAWAPGLRQRIAGGSGAAAAADGLQERAPPLALDALVAVYARCQGGAAAGWALQCTPLEALVAGSLAQAQALSTTAVHSIVWAEEEARAAAQ